MVLFASWRGGFLNGEELAEMIIELTGSKSSFFKEDGRMGAGKTRFWEAQKLPKM